MSLLQAKVPTDIPASVLNKASEVIETQLGYVKQLGTYITTSLKVCILYMYIPVVCIGICKGDL